MFNLTHNDLDPVPIVNLPTQTSLKEMYAMNCTYSQVHKYWDIDTILTFLALYTTTMDFKWNKQDVL